MALMTAGYMAPELLLGRPPEPRSDLYGLGAVLYMMLTGKLPFDGDSMAALLEGAVRHEAEAPSLSRAEVPQAVDRIVLKALEQNPAQRYQNAEEMAVDLEALMAPDPRDLIEKRGAADSSPWASGRTPEGARGRGHVARASGTEWVDGPSIPLAVPELDRLVNPRKSAADHEVFGPQTMTIPKCRRVRKQRENQAGSREGPRGKTQRSGKARPRRSS